MPCALRAVVKRSLLVVVSFSSDRRSLELVANTVEAYILDLVTDLDLVLWSRLVESFKKNAGLADFLTREVSTLLALAHDLLCRLPGCETFLSFLSVR